ncbi:e6a2e47f-130a-4163-be4d-1102e987562e [Thermothielavioides terrestris]|uniref:E6a2e47f-130a-4163-be4d-1102e987562e n=1 Tax=Thermothielavioides terrestris TaxID=2587410 RepID=A0A3S4B7V6_9PEZI|nr:e6a2e47f-130a-4163-be4d-1102e987562e [Thermothielavioides terrestris]
MSKASQQQQQHQSLLLLDNNTNSDLDSLGFDPLISTFDDIDFYDTADEPLEATRLEELSRTLQQSRVLLDGMLCHTSQLLVRIREALQQQLYSGGAAAPDQGPSPSSATALVLILVCLAQAVALFEQCDPAVLAGRSPGGAEPNAADLSLRIDYDAHGPLYAR